MDLDRQRLTVRRGRVPVAGGRVIETSPKQKRVRIVQLDPDTVDVLRKLRSSRTVVSITDGGGWVFVDDAGEPLNPHSVTYQFRKTVEQLRMRRIPLHGLRHTHITQLIDAGVPVNVVAQRAGHVNANVTLAVYTHCFDQQMAVAVVAQGMGRKASE